MKKYNNNDLAVILLETLVEFNKTKIKAQKSNEINWVRQLSKRVNRYKNKKQKSITVTSYSH